MIKKILIVDDSRVARIMMQHSIPSDKGYEIIIAVDGKDGVEKYHQFKPDVTFMDLTMPRLDGCAATEQILGYDPDAIVIIFTADIHAKAVPKLKELGAFAVVQKPATPPIIKEMLDEIGCKLKARY